MPKSPGFYINNSWGIGSGEPFESHNPANGKLLWAGASASAMEIDQAVHHARKAFAPWAHTPIEKRLGHLRAFASALKEREAAMSEAIAKETGKPLWESKTEVASMIQKVEISADAQEKRCSTTTKAHPLGSSTTRHRPHGVIAVFGPFNFPGHLPNGHIIPALLAGNTVVFKPSEQTPLVAEEMMKCWESASLPAGTINMVQGGRKTGQALAQHPNINGVFLTGSFSTGTQLSQLFAARPEIILALEMGGNNPIIVGDISDLQAAAYAIVLSAYLTAGQRCTCARRLILLEGQSDAVTGTLKTMVERLKVGAYTETPEPFMGPVISDASAKHILAAQESLIDKGAIPLLRVKHLREGTGLISPGLMDVTQCHNLPDEEIFGPLLQIIRVGRFNEAIQAANNTSYGLAATLLSDKEEQHAEFLANIKAGIANWNVPTTGASSAAPFGGIGRSGNHRPSAYYAADYCNYPVASIEAPGLRIPDEPIPGIL